MREQSLRSLRSTDLAFGGSESIPGDRECSDLSAPRQGVGMAFGDGHAAGWQGDEHA